MSRLACGVRQRGSWPDSIGFSSPLMASRGRFLIFGTRWPVAAATCVLRAAPSAIIARIMDDTAAHLPILALRRSLPHLDRHAPTRSIIPVAPMSRRCDVRGRSMATDGACGPYPTANPTADATCRPRSTAGLMRIGQYCVERVMSTWCGCVVGIASDTGVRGKGCGSQSCVSRRMLCSRTLHRANSGPS